MVTPVIGLVLFGGSRTYVSYRYANQEGGRIAFESGSFPSPHFNSHRSPSTSSLGFLSITVFS